MFSIGTKSIKALQALVNSIVQQQFVTKRVLYKLLGKINFFRNLSTTTAAVLAPIYAITKTVDDWTTPIPVTSDLQQHLRMLSAEVPRWKLSAGVSTDVLVISTDASNEGVGVSVSTTEGSELHAWSLQHKTTSTDAAFKELTGVYEFLRHNDDFLRNTTATVWHVQMDNLPAINFLRRSVVPVDAKKQSLLAKIFALFATYVNVNVMFYHIAGVDNGRADLLSRSHNCSSLPVHVNIVAFI
eukprot:Lankesteria_metandrocarpae@DN5480_c0_g2_i1.p1